MPGAITPPLYTLPITTSKVVAVPKSNIIKFLFFENTAIEFANLSDPICYLLTFIFIILFKFNFFNSIHLILNFFFIKDLIKLN